MPHAPDPARILHLSTWNVPFGIATYCGNLVAALDRQGIQSDVYPLFPHAWNSYLQSDIRRMRDEILERARAADLVHVQHEHGLFGVALGARGAAKNFGRILAGLLGSGKPVVTTFHTAPLLGKRHEGFGALLDLLKRFGRDRAWRTRVAGQFTASAGRALAIVHSATTRHALVQSGFPEESVRVVAHGCLPPRDPGVDAAAAKEALGLAPTDTLLTIFGFIGRYKGHDVALRALTHLPPEFRLAICGGAHPESKDSFFNGLLRQVDRLKLHDRVTITGWLSPADADRYYAATDICLAPYRPESGLSASGAITWALSSGRPVVASKIDAFLAIQREANCMLMTTPEQPKEMAWAVRSLASDSAAAARLVRGAGEFCRRHSWDNVARESIGIYNDALAAHAVGAGGGRPIRPIPLTIPAVEPAAPPIASASITPPPMALDESIRQTQSLEGWCPLEKAEALARLVLDTRPACIAEIGVFGGRSLIPMALAAQSYGGEVHAIDPWSHAASLEGEIGDDNRIWWGQLDIEGVYSRFLEGVRRFEVEDTIRVHRTTDTAAVGDFRDGQIGLLHVDGNHSAAVSRRYVEQWGPKIAPGGHLVMDDIDWATQAETVAFIEQRYAAIRREHSWAIYRKPGGATARRPLAA